MQLSVKSFPSVEILDFIAFLQYDKKKREGVYVLLLKVKWYECLYFTGNSYVKMCNFSFSFRKMRVVNSLKFSTQPGLTMEYLMIQVTFWILFVMYETRGLEKKSQLLFIAGILFPALNKWIIAC